MTKREIITVGLPNNKQQQHMLPEGVRSVDVLNLNNEDCNILLDIFSSGRRSRYWYKKRGLMDEVRKLKTRGFIEPVKAGSNYAYDLTQFGYYAIKNHMV